jgi:hypothetical protein
MSIRRRDAAWLLAAGVLPSRLLRAQHQAHALQKRKAPYQPQFFSKDEHLLVNTLAGLIIPDDDHSPGAATVGAADLIDLIVTNSSAEVQSRWRTQMAAFRQLATKPEDALRLAAAEENAPRSEATRFFVTMKQMTILAYYTSETGMRKELGYQGGAVLAKFPGCTA